MSKSQMRRIKIQAPEIVNQLVLETRDATLEEVALIADAWTKTQHILLHAGEMTSKELKAVKACAKVIAAVVRGMKGTA